MQKSTLIQLQKRMKEALYSREGLRIRSTIKFPLWQKHIIDWGEGGCSILGQAFQGWMNNECFAWCLREPMDQYLEREGLTGSVKEEYAQNEWHLIHVLCKIDDYFVDENRVQEEEPFLHSYPPFRRGFKAEVVPYKKSEYLYEDIPTDNEYVQEVLALFDNELGDWNEWKELDKPRVMKTKTTQRNRIKRKK